jgi:hypothetical protein
LTIGAAMAARREGVGIPKPSLKNTEQEELYFKTVMERR